MGKENKATFSMQQVKEILKMHEEIVFGFIKITVERFETKLDKLTHEIHGINRDIMELKETSQVQDVEEIEEIEEIIKKRHLQTFLLIYRKKSRQTLWSMQK